MYIRVYNFERNEDGKLQKVQYDYTSTPEQQSRAARDNALLDIELGILRNKQVDEALFNPGSFDEIKREARVDQILSETANNGRTRNNKIVHIPYDKDITGEFVNVKITRARTWYLNGEMI